MKEAQKKLIKKIFLIGVLTLALFLLDFLYLRHQVVSSANVVTQKRTELESLKIQDNDIKDLRADYEKVIGKTDKIFNAIPSQDDVVNFINELETIAKRREVRQGIKVSSSIEDDVEDSLKTVEISLSLETSYANYINFMTDVYYLKYYHRITNIEFRRKVSSSDISVVVTLNLYVKEE